MVSRKVKKQIFRNWKNLFEGTPATFLTASFIASFVLPLNVASAEEVAAEENPTLVSPSEENESSLDYLVLTDSFVTAERIPSKRMDTPANVIVITAAQIEANHYKDIQEAISHINGAYFSHAEWNVNGSQRVAVLVDGHRTDYTPPMQVIERIEIVKGGASALYGSEAVGGVVNIITKTGESDETKLDFSTGSWHTHMYELMNQGTSERFSWVAYGGLSQSRTFDYKGNGHEPHDLNLLSDSDKKDAFIKLDYNIDDRNSLELSFQHLGDRHNKYGQLAAYFPDYYAGDDPYYYDKANDFSLTYNFKEGSAVPGFLRYVDNNKVARTIITEYDYHTHLQGIDYQNGWEFGEHKVIVGLEYHRTRDFGYLLSYNHKKVNNTAYYLQDTISIGDKLTVIPGVRLDHNSVFGNQWSPKVAANYRIDDNTKVFASWGKTYKAPSIEEFYTTDLGNPNLNPEKGHAESIGFERSFDDRSVARVNFFQNKIEGIIFQTTLGDEIYQYTNSYTDKQRGVELSWAQKMDDNWSYDVGYVHTDSKGGTYSDPDWVGITSPRHSYHIGVHYDNGPFKANLFGIMGSGYPNSSRFDPTSYARFDMNMSYDVTDWATVYLKGLNLTDRSYSYHHYQIHSPGRFLMAGAQFKF